MKKGPVCKAKPGQESNQNNSADLRKNSFSGRKTLKRTKVWDCNQLATIYKWLVYEARSRLLEEAAKKAAKRASKRINHAAQKETPNDATRIFSEK